MERGIVKPATFKSKPHQKGVARFKIKGQHFAVGKKNVIEATVAYVGMAQVTAFKTTFHKVLVVQKGIGKTALAEGTIYILRLGQGTLAKVLPNKFAVMDIGCCHGWESMIPPRYDFWTRRFP